MNAATLLTTLNNRGVTLMLTDAGKLRIQAPPGSLDDALKQLCRDRKEELIKQLETSLFEVMKRIEKVAAMERYFHENADKWGAEEWGHRQEVLLDKIDALMVVLTTRGETLADYGWTADGFGWRKLTDPRPDYPVPAVREAWEQIAALIETKSFSLSGVDWEERESAIGEAVLRGDQKALEAACESLLSLACERWDAAGEAIENLQVEFSDPVASIEKSGGGWIPASNHGLIPARLAREKAHNCAYPAPGPRARMLEWAEANGWPAWSRTVEFPGWGPPDPTDEKRPDVPRYQGREVTVAHAGGERIWRIFAARCRIQLL